MNQTHGGTAAVVDLAKQGQVTEPHRVGHLYFIAGIQGVGHQAIDLAGFDAGIVNCPAHRLAGQREFRDARALAVRGLTDAGDSGRIV